MTADADRARPRLREQAALRVLDAAILMLRLAAILVLLSPVLGIAILLG